MSSDIALYVHVPFCRRKCRYCSFISYEQRERDIPRYLEALKKELKLRYHDDSIRTIYIGGGTPSLLKASDIADLLSAISGLCQLDKDAEISIEVNPGTVDQNFFQTIRKAGVNRLSLGIQSLNDDELAIMGRIHTSIQAREAVRLARSEGFDNINLDLIYGLPAQTKEAWQYSLEEAIALEPEHLSLYALTLEEDTPMQKMIDDGLMTKIDPDMAADQYEIAEDLLEKHGYIHYEISNWAKPGYPCRHNLVYWYNLPYLGIGAAAHSCINGHRIANTGNLDKYLAEFTGENSWSPELDEKISRELEIAESVILGLRLAEGVQQVILKNRFGVNIMDRFRRQIKEMSDAGLLIQDDGHISLTPRGRLLSNEVFWRFLPE